MPSLVAFSEELIQPCIRKFHCTVFASGFFGFCCFGVILDQLVERLSYLMILLH